MKMDFGLNLNQEQRLVMTQELQLSVKLLQLSTYELLQYTNEQVLENPLLEYREKGDGEESKPEEVGDKIEAKPDEIDAFLEGTSFDQETYYNGEEEVSPFNFVSKEINLWDFLKEQLDYMPMDRECYRIGLYIIDNIDENGYLTASVEQIQEATSRELGEVLQALKIIQSYEPNGVGGRNINECLKLQLINTGIEDRVLFNIIDNMLLEISEGKLALVAKRNDITEEKVREYVKIIKELNPRPGLEFFSDTIKYVIPDVYIEKIGADYIVSVNEEGIPKLKINKTYRELLNNKNSDAYKYVRDKLQAAIWMIKSIEQRIGTIKKVVEAIVEYQREFFDGNGHMKPLTLKQIAVKIDMHESTVSRAVNGKYAQTPNGLFELKNFFVRGFENSDGIEISTARIKNTIKELVNGENPEKPYSDALLCEKLSKLGMNIKRRTVAKYREELLIPPSSKRRK